MKNYIQISSATFSIVAIALGLFFYFTGPIFFERVELFSIDLRFKVRPPIKPHGDVVLAVIDEKSIDREGKWVWPREKFATMVSRLSDAGAKVIGFDVGFLEPDRNSVLLQKTLAGIQERMAASCPSDPEFQSYVEALLADADQDKLLSAAIAAASEKAGAKVVLGYFFHTHLEGQDIPSAREMRALQRGISGSEYKIRQYSENADESVIPLALFPESNIEAIAAATPYAGHFNMRPDMDGVVRRIPMVYRYGEVLYAPLSLVSAAAFLDEDYSIRIDATGVASVRLGSRKIPVDPEGQIIVNYRGEEKTFPTYSVTDIIRGDFSDDAFRDKIVMVGATAIGIYDMRVTPLDSTFPGLEIHANVTDNLLKGDFMEQPYWVGILDILSILILGPLLWFALERFRITFGILAFVLFFAGYIAFSEYMFTVHQVIINTVYPLFTMLMIFTGIMLQQARQRKFIRDAFSYYLAPSVVKQLIDSPRNLVLGGENRYITAFFSDVQGFTSISEKMAPEALVELLNEYLTEMTDIILRHEGTVDKFEGDAIIAFFGAPNELENHALTACKAAVDMQKRLAQLRAGWEKNNRPSLKMRIGMCTGYAVVGNMGSKNRMDYTMIGDTVNTASRLEGLNKLYGLFTLATEQTVAEMNGEIFTREVDMISVVGKTEPVKVFEIIDYAEKVDDDTKRVAEIYGEGLAAYRKGEWKAAEATFRKVLAVKSDDGPALTMIERCVRFQEKPPEGEWRGIFTAKTK